MKAVRIVAPGKLEYTEVPSRHLEAGEVRIAVAVTSICGSDLKNLQAPVMIPQTPGHEFSGAVVEISVETPIAFKVGDKVTAFPMKPCMACVACSEGRFRDCDSKLSLGFQLPGSFAEEIVVPSHLLIPIKSGLSFEQGALVEHLSVGYRLAQEIISHRVTNDSHIVIIGDGPIALADIQSLLLFNYRNISLIGKHLRRLNLARKLGASQIFSLSEVTSAIEKNELLPIDVCIFAAPADATLKQLFPLMRQQGIVFPQTRIKDAEALSFILSNTSGLGRAFAYYFADFSIMMDLISDKKIETDSLISNRINLSKFNTESQDIQKSSNACKTMIINERFNEIIKKYKEQNT